MSAATAVNSKPQTGPRTPEGKQRSSQNSTKHGLTAKHTVVREGDRADYNELRRQLREDINPQGALEQISFNHLLHAAWCLQRAERIEEQLMTSSENPFADQEVARQLDNLTRYRAAHQRAKCRPRRSGRRIRWPRL